MKYFNENSAFEDLSQRKRVLLQTLLNNRRILGEDHNDPDKVASAVRYRSQETARMKTHEPENLDNFNEISNQVYNDFFDFDQVTKMQVESWNKIVNFANKDGENGILINAPTGFGKTAAFMNPLASLLANSGTDVDNVVLVYPRKALIRDQLSEVLKLVNKVNEGVEGREWENDLSVGLYSSDIPYSKEGVPTSSDLLKDTGNAKIFRYTSCPICDEEENVPLFFNSNRNKKYYSLNCPNGHNFDHTELKLYRSSIGFNPPNILLTTLESLETISLKPNYKVLDSTDVILFDEIHLFNGVYGSHASNIIKNIRENKEESPLLIGSSATLSSAENFGSKIFQIENDSNLHTISTYTQDEHYPGDEENYYFIRGNEEMGLTSTMIEELSMMGHSMLREDEENDSGKEDHKILSFINSVSQVNQNYFQFVDAEQSELYQYHNNRELNDDWPFVSETYDFSFIDGKLHLSKSHAGDQLSEQKIEKSHIILSTSTLEVGVDIDDIKIVSQYKVPWKFSSFIQRIGRAARQEGMDAHYMMFLGDDENDRNVFYRADRFLDKEHSTPITNRNDFINWMHNKFSEYYKTAKKVKENSEPERDEDEIKREIIREFVLDNLKYDKYYQLVFRPSDLEDFLDSEIESDNLLGPEKVDTLISTVESRKKNILSKFEEIFDFIDRSEEILLKENAREDLVDSTSDEVINLLNNFQDFIEDDDFQRFYQVEVRDGEYEELLDSINECIDGISSSAEGYDREEITLEERVSNEKDYATKAKLKVAELDHKLSKADGKHTADNDAMRKIEADLVEVLDKLETIVSEEGFSDIRKHLKKLYYLRSCLDLLKEFNTTPKQHYSLHAMKNLIRSAYYYNEYLKMDDKSYLGKCYYIPDNYFGSGGKTFTVYKEKGSEEEQPRSEQEEMSKILTKHVPFKAEYESNFYEGTLFYPEAKIVERDDVESKVIDFKGFDGDRRDMDVVEPSSVHKNKLKDKSDGWGVIRYCPRCYKPLKSNGICSTHQTYQEGSLRGDATVESQIHEQKKGGRNISSFTVKDMDIKTYLEQVEITAIPASYKGRKIGWVKDYDNKEEFDAVPDRKIGYIQETRGIKWEVDHLWNELGRENLLRYKEHDNKKELFHHSLSHLLLMLISDVSGVKMDELDYIYNLEDEEIFVHEKVVGGQGIVDLFIETLEDDPRSVYKSFERIAYNPQIIAEKIWAEGIEDHQKILNEEIDISEKLDYRIETSEIPEKVLEELKASIQRLESFESDVNIEEKIKLKEKVNSEIFEGEYSREKVSQEYEWIDETTLEDIIEPVDIDECMINLQLNNCEMGENQAEYLSNEMITSVIELLTTEGRSDSMVEEGMMPYKVEDDEKHFLTF